MFWNRRFWKVVCCLHVFFYMHCFHDNLFCFPFHIAFIYLQPFMQRSYIINHTKSDRHGFSCITFLWSRDSHPMKVAHAGVNNMENTSIKCGAHNKSTDAITFLFYQFSRERTLFILYFAYKSIKWECGLLERWTKISKQNRQGLFKSKEGWSKMQYVCNTS